MVAIDFFFFFSISIDYLLVAIYTDCIDIAQLVSTIESRDGAN